MADRNLGVATAHAMSAVLSQVLRGAASHDIIAEIDPRLLRSDDRRYVELLAAKSRSYVDRLGLSRALDLRRPAAPC